MDFTGEDFDLNISNPENPSILVIGNNPDRFQSYGVLLSLLNGKLTKTINKKGQLPLGIIVDECPTLPFESLSVLIATARSNMVACILGIQDLAQFVLLYGQEKANMIVNMVGSILTGQIRGELAKIISECIGKINQINIQESLSAQGVSSYSISEQQIEAVPVSTISNLDQGEMAGTISGDFKTPLKYRRFHGRIDAMDYQASPTTKMPIKQIPELNEDFKRKGNETEEERNLRYVNNNIIYAAKTILSNFESPVCQNLRVHYNQFELLLYNEIQDPRFKTNQESVSSPEEEMVDESGLVILGDYWEELV